MSWDVTALSLCLEEERECRPSPPLHKANNRQNGKLMLLLNIWLLSLLFLNSGSRLEFSAASVPTQLSQIKNKEMILQKGIDQWEKGGLNLVSLDWSRFELITLKFSFFKRICVDPILWEAFNSLVNPVSVIWNKWLFPTLYPPLCSLVNTFNIIFTFLTVLFATLLTSESCQKTQPSFAQLRQKLLART
jgi:hypothetical protein